MATSAAVQHVLYTYLYGRCTRDLPSSRLWSVVGSGRIDIISEMPQYVWGRKG